jgi:hypothetical protein
MHEHGASGSGHAIEFFARSKDLTPTLRSSTLWWQKALASGAQCAQPIPVFESDVR